MMNTAPRSVLAALATLASTLPLTAQDLAATRLVVRANVARPGQDFPVESTIKNVDLLFGTGKTVQSTYYLSDVPILVPALATRLATFNTPPLGPGKAAQDSRILKMPRDITSGQYYVFVRANSNRALFELNLLNNDRFAGLEGTATDLTASLVAPGPLTAGTDIKVTVNAENRGTLRSQATVALLFASPDPIIDTSDVYLGRVPIPPIDGKKAVGLGRTVRLPASSRMFVLAAQTALGVIINPPTASRVPESDYKNNTSLLLRMVNVARSGRVVEWRPEFREDGIGPTSLGAAAFRVPQESALGHIHLTAPKDGLTQYVLVMSGNGSQFAWDKFTDIGVVNLNGPLFPNWFATLDPFGHGEAKLFVPRMGLYGFTVFIYPYFLNLTNQDFGDNRLQADFAR